MTKRLAPPTCQTPASCGSSRSDGAWTCISMSSPPQLPSRAKRLRTQQDLDPEVRPIVVVTPPGTYLQLPTLEESLTPPPPTDDVYALPTVRLTRRKVHTAQDPPTAWELGLMSIPSLMDVHVPTSSNRTRRLLFRPSKTSAFQSLAATTP